MHFMQFVQRKAVDMVISMKEYINWGMIGCGDVTEVKNGPGLYQAEHSRLLGITNRTRSKAESWVERHGAGKVYDSVEELLSDPEIDIVYIATTPDCHKDLAIACAEAGKHCYVEKPIALSYEEAEEIQRAFEKSGTKIFVAHYRRGMSRYRKIKRLLEEGAIGKVRGMQMLRTQKQTEQDRLPDDQKPWRLRSNVSGGGYFFETEIHMLDLIDFLVGAPAEFTLVQSNETGYYEAADTVSLSLKTETGVMVSGLWCYATDVEQDRTVIYGDKGAISYQYSFNDGPIRLETADGIQEFTPFLHPNVGTEQIQDIVNDLLGKGSCSSTLEAAMRALKITDTAEKQWRSRKR